MKRTIAVVVSALISGTASAMDPCFQDPGTRAMTCIDGKHIRSNGDLRASYLYSGGPNGVRKTGYRIIADCKRRVTVLQDASGVNFGGGKFDSTTANSALSQWLCEATKTTPDKRLTQF